jgi:hypothetical protein
MKLIPLFASTLALAACASPPYLDKAGPDTARVVVRNQSLGQITVAVYDDGNECSEQRLVSDSDSKYLQPGARKEIRVPSRKTFAVRAFYGMCSVTGSFVPEAEKSYVVTADGKSTGFLEQCSLNVETFVQRPGSAGPELVREPTFRRMERVAGMLHGGKSCR